MKINQCTLERVIRAAVGAALILAGLVLVRGIIGIILAVVGAIVLFSGTVGFCHVYKVLHIDTSKKA